MASGSLLVLLDDIAAILDDVALMTKLAAKKTAGVLGDDLALNAQQVSGVNAERELPVVYAVAKGSLLNKAILAPTALAISAFVPWLVTPLLMLGGTYLCFEGFEKIAHKFLHSAAEDTAHHAAELSAVSDPSVDMVEFEQEKIKGAIRTDFILSAEIIVIALGSVKEAPLMTQVAVVVTIALIMTVGVYGFVAGIVKMDDAGLHLIQSPRTGVWASIKHAVGRGLLVVAPVLMKTLTIVGTIAMFMVGGGILVHGIPHSHEVLEQGVAFAHQAGGFGGEVLAYITPSMITTVAGVVAGALALLVVALMGWLVGKFRRV